MFASFCIVCAALFTSCDKIGDDNSSSGGNNVTPADGLWKVSYFFDKKDETSDYATYTFQFNSDGSLKASNGSLSWSGAWRTGFDDSKNKFDIDFNGTVPSALSELEEDWLIVHMKDDFMHFEHRSGGDGDTDVLHFSK